MEEIAKGGFNAVLEKTECCEDAADDNEVSCSWPWPCARALAIIMRALKIVSCLRKMAVCACRAKVEM